MSDLISRQAVLDVLDMYLDNLEMIKDDIKALPSITLVSDKQEKKLKTKKA